LTSQQDDPAHGGRRHSRHDILQGAQGTRAKLVLVDRTIDKLKSDFKDDLVFAADITRPEAWHEIKADLDKRGLFVNVLINNAAAKSENFFDPFEAYKIEDWNYVMSINLTAAMIGCQVFGADDGEARARLDRQRFLHLRIVAPDQRIYEGSEYEGRPINTPAVYSASKAAIVGLTNYLATYWGASGVRVNCITPAASSAARTRLSSRNTPIACRWRGWGRPTNCTARWFFSPPMSLPT
jgi:NAD(P)-dependent dehydrogenase (short-subunit alcohol dehydrogenase family)